MAKRDCFTLLDENVSRQDIEKLLEIPPIYKRIKETIRKYDNARLSIPKFQSVVQEIQNLIINQFPSSAVFTDQNWEWLRSLKTFVSSHRGDYERTLLQQDAFPDIKRVKQLFMDDSINQLLRDVLNKTTQVKFGEKRCDSTFTFDLDDIDYSINFAKNINNIKGTTETVMNFVAAVEKMQKSFNELGEESKIGTKKASKRNTDDVVSKEYNDDPSLLLNFSDAAYSLEQLNKLDDQLSLLIRKGDDVVAVIRKMNDSKEKTELNNTWKDFKTLKKKLIEFQTKSIKILESVKSSKFSQPERTLQEVGLMYKEISTILINGSFDLRKMRESMILLNPRIPDVESALVYLEAPLAMNWNLTQRSFQSVPDVLFAGQKIIQQMKSGQVTAEPQTMKSIIIGIVVTLGIIVVAIIVVIALVCWWVKREDPDLKLDPPPERVYIAPHDQYYKFSYMQLQDCRLKINSRDPITGNTPLFDAVLRKDYVKVRELVEEGVVLDAVCGGESLRTALFQLEFQKNKEMCALLLKRGADQLLVDAAGEDCETWADDNGVGQIFKEYYELRQNHRYTKPRRIIPDETPRSWNVLVFDGGEFKGFKRKKLPLRIKKRITWGYVEGMNLDEFTHIVVPSKYVSKSSELMLDDEDLMTFKLYVCKAVLMKRYWLQALVEWKDRAMDEDYRWYLLDTLYEGSSHCDAIYNIKTNYYRMVPCLLKNADICILPSTSNDFEKNRNEWKKIIETLGGTYVNVTDVKPDNPKTITPYWTGTQEYKDEHGLSQNRCWILKTEGCQINSEWRKDRGMYTLADFRFLTESIAKHSILSKDNLIEPLDYEGRPVVDLSWSAPEPPSKSLPTDRKTPVMSPMEAMKDAEMKKRQQEMKEEIKKASSKAAVNQ